MEERVEQRALSTGMWLTVVSKAAMESVMMRTGEMAKVKLVLKRLVVGLGVDSLHKGKR